MCARLEKDGWQLSRVDVRTPGGRDCRDVFRHWETRFDLVVHLAAVVGGRVNIDSSPMSVAVDLAIDSDFFQYVLRTQPPRAVYFSSSAAYPVALQTGDQTDWASGRLHRLRDGGMRLHETDIDLDHVSDPDAIYGWVKLTGERLARIANERGASVYVFRPFSGYGGDQDPSYPFGKFRQEATSDVPRIQPWYILGDGTQVRDWVHISDVVEHVVQALEWDPHTIGPQNICTGVGTSMLDLVTMFQEEYGGPRRQVKPLGTHPGVQYRVGDPTQSHKIYKPQVMIRDGVARSRYETP